MATPLEQKLLKRLSAGERIRLDQFMQAALLDPEHGYYTNEKVFGKEGDFTTAPEISQIFGEMIAAYLAANIAPMKETPALVELGPGRGTLMSDMLRVLSTLPPTDQPNKLVMVEASEQLQNKQRETLQSAALPISWEKDITNLPKQPCIIVANEFFDALPIRQFVYDNEWQERYLGCEDDRLVWTNKPTEPPSIVEKYSAPLNQGDIIEYAEASINVMKQLADHLREYGGMLVMIDYGYMDYAYGDTLQAVKSHEYVDVLSNIGEADITAHVNFVSMRDIAEEAGLKTHLLITQGQFLRVLGAELRAAALCKNANEAQQKELLSGLERLISPAQMGELFKVLVVANQDMDVVDIGL